MAKLRFTGRSLARFAAIASALLVVGLLSSAPANSSAAITSKGLAQKPGTALHVGTVNLGQRHQFTIILKSASRTDAETVVTYLHRFNLLSEISPTGKFIHVTGTFGSSAAAAGVQFERIKVASETFVRTTGPAHFPPAIQRLIAGTSISPGVKMRALYVKPRPQALVAGPQTGYGPADFAGIYHINPVYGSGVDGTGSTVDIAACFNIDPADIAYFETFYGLPANHVHVIHIDGTVDQFGNVPPPDLEPTLDVERVDEAITERTVALMPVHFGGQSADMARLGALAVRHNLAIIEDSAEAIGAAYGVRRTGSFGLGCFSFFATKSVSEFTSTRTPALVPSSSAITRPLAAVRSARLPMSLRPLIRSASSAAVKSPSAASSAFLQSRIPAPVCSRSRFTSAAL